MWHARTVAPQISGITYAADRGQTAPTYGRRLVALTPLFEVHGRTDRPGTHITFNIKWAVIPDLFDVVNWTRTLVSSTPTDPNGAAPVVVTCTNVLDIYLY
jgi:hypothetical protein